MMTPEQYYRLTAEEVDYTTPVDESLSSLGLRARYSSDEHYWRDLYIVSRRMGDRQMYKTIAHRLGISAGYASQLHRTFSYRWPPWLRAEYRKLYGTCYGPRLYVIFEVSWDRPEHAHPWWRWDVNDYGPLPVWNLTPVIDQRVVEHLLREVT